MSAAATLWRLGDKEGLRRIAREHPNEKVREMAASLARECRMTKSNSPGGQ